MTNGRAPEQRIISYGEAIREAFHHLLANYPEVIAIGQGLWSPWYVGETMTDLEIEFGKDRIIDSPVSELATTGAAIGAALGGYRPIVVHPRMDFMLLASDAIVNHAAKWPHMLGGASRVPITIRGIINRGGEQGSQHSQALHSWYAHIPGLRVVMPATVADARDLLIASVLSPDPVIYIDDRWLYDLRAPVDEPGSSSVLALEDQGPVLRRHGDDATLVGASFTTHLCMEAANILSGFGVETSVVDLRIINPLDVTEIVKSVNRTGNLFVVDGSWRNCGLAGEIIASVMEHVDMKALNSNPVRITLPDAPAPTSKPLEEDYYITVEQIVNSVTGLMDIKKPPSSSEKVA